jgi:phosphate transport system substrate-binding protein
MTLAVAACGGGGTAPGDSDEPSLSGAVAADGSSTVGPLTEAAADLYREEQPGVNVTVGISGTGGGFEKFCKGETDISNASRKIKDVGEKDKCVAAGITPTEFIVANDGISIVVNPQNTWVDCLTVAELKSIWDQGSTLSNWSQVRAGFPNEPLSKDQLFGPGTDSGTFDFFTAAINGKEKQSRADYTASEDDNVLVQGVASSKGGLGYFGFTYYEENQDKLKLVKVDGGSGCQAPSVASIQDNSYKPLSRPLFVYVSSKSTSRPQVVDFVEFYVNNIDEIVTEAKYVPLTASQKAELAAANDEFKASS